jgi:hypothetical protein
MPDDRELSEDELAELFAPKTTQTSSVPGTTKRVKYNKNIRTISNWFKLQHTLEGKCEVPSHDEGRKPRDKGMLFDMGTYKICRWCFIESRDVADNMSLGE